MSDHTKLTAGQVKAIKLKIKDLSGLIEQLESLGYQASRAQGFDPDFAAETEALKNAIQAKISKLQTQLKQDRQAAGGEFEKFWKEKIATNCSEILQVYKKSKRVLYRGVTNPTGDAFVGRSQDNRKPKDSNKFAQVLFDEYLTKLGIQALRSNSIFTTADYHQALGYGEVYIIFPINGFNYSYTNEDDLVINSINSLIDRVVLNKIALLIGPERLKKFKLAQNPWNNYHMFEGTDIKAFFEKVKADPVLSKNPYIQSLKLENLLNIKKFVQQYKPSNKDLAKPMKDFREICINGSYYALSYKKYHQLVEKQLRINIAGSQYI